MKKFSPIFYVWYRNALRNTQYRWIIVLGSLIYLLSPMDISPDVVPVVGWIDDGIVASLLVTEVSQVALEALKQRKRSLKAD